MVSQILIRSGYCLRGDLAAQSIMFTRERLLIQTFVFMQEQMSIVRATEEKHMQGVKSTIRSI